MANGNGFDTEFTKLVSGHIQNAKGFYDYGIEKGLTTAEAVKMTIIKKERPNAARKLVEGGLSRRKAALLLGVSEGTIRNDLKETCDDGDDDGSAQYYAKTAKKSAPGNGKSSTKELLTQSDQNDWRTPLKYLEAARKVLGGIDLDPASGAEANQTVKATTFYTEADDGLEKPWKGKVWLNPPYGGEARLFVERLIKEYQVGNVTAACLLVNSHPTETKWFQALFDYTVCFIAGRIDFGGPSREISSTSTHGSAIVYLGEDWKKFAVEFSRFGSVTRKVPVKLIVPDDVEEIDNDGTESE